MYKYIYMYIYIYKYIYIYNIYIYNKYINKYLYIKYIYIYIYIAELLKKERVGFFQSIFEENKKCKCSLPDSTKGWLLLYSKQIDVVTKIN